MDRLTSARDPAFAEKLANAIHGEVRQNESLARYSTYRIGGPATVVLPAVAEDVGIALRLCADAGVPWFAFGLGSNILLPDNGLDALVIRLGRGLDELVHLGGGVWRVGAGLPQPLAARRTVDAGYSGLHRFVGVPGSCGGGVYMNAGCHGGDWAEVVESVTAVDGSGRDELLPRSDIPFAYRESGLVERIVLAATVCLAPGDPVALQAEINELFEWRERGTPFNKPCCGSVFRNPAGPSWGQGDGPKTAGQLIEAVGLKGVMVGRAQVSPLHANYFVNTGSASAADVQQLMRRARDEVADQFGVTLEPEVKLIGRWGNYMLLSEGEA